MFFPSLLFAEGRRQQRLEFGCCLGAVWGRRGGSSLFLHFSQPKFRGELPRSTQAPGSANTLRHKRGRIPSFTLRALPCPGASGLRELASSSRAPPGGREGSRRGERRHDPPSPHKPAQPEAAGAGVQPALNAEVAAVHAANKKNPPKQNADKYPRPSKEKNGTTTEIARAGRSGAEKLAPCQPF